jgi:hypothetical protein
VNPDAFIADFVHKYKEELTDNWMKIVRNQQLTRSYQAFDQEKARERALTVLSQLSRWLAGDLTKGDIESTYTALGARRRREGFSLAEVVRALTVTRRVLWFKFQAEGVLEKKVLDARQALEINNRVVQFFDRAIYFTAVGFERQ